MNEDKIIEKLLEHDDKFVSLGQELSNFKDEYLRGQDTMMKILLRLDQERIFTREAIRRMQDELDEQKEITNRHEITLKKIMLQLNLA